MEGVWSIQILFCLEKIYSYCFLFCYINANKYSIYFQMFVVFNFLINIDHSFYLKKFKLKFLKYFHHWFFYNFNFLNKMNY
jgi:hypothetical protein